MTNEVTTSVVEAVETTPATPVAETPVEAVAEGNTPEQLDDFFASMNADIEKLQGMTAEITEEDKKVWNARKELPNFPFDGILDNEKWGRMMTWFLRTMCGAGFVGEILSHPAVVANPETIPVFEARTVYAAAYKIDAKHPFLRSELGRLQQEVRNIITWLAENKATVSSWNQMSKEDQATINRLITLLEVVDPVNRALAINYATAFYDRFKEDGGLPKNLWHRYEEAIRNKNRTLGQPLPPDAQRKLQAVNRPKGGAITGDVDEKPGPSPKAQRMIDKANRGQARSKDTGGKNTGNPRMVIGKDGSAVTDGGIRIKGDLNVAVRKEANGVPAPPTETAAATEAAAVN